MRAARYLGTLSSTFNYQFNDLFLCFCSTKIGKVKSKPAVRRNALVRWSRNVAMHEACLCFAVFLAAFSDGTIQFSELISLEPLAIPIDQAFWQRSRHSASRCHFAFKLVKQPVQASHGRGRETRSPRLLVNVDANDFGDCSKRQQKRTKSKTSEKLWRTWPTSWTTDTTLQLRNIIYAVYFLMPFRVFFFASFNRAAQHRRMLRRAFTFHFRLFFQRVFPTLRGCRDGTRSFNRHRIDDELLRFGRKRNQIELVVFEGRIVSRGVYEGCVTTRKLLSWISSFIGSLKAQSNCEESDFRSLKLGCVLDLRNGSLVSFILFRFQCTSRMLDWSLFRRANNVKFNQREFEIIQFMCSIVDG